MDMAMFTCHHLGEFFAVLRYPKTLADTAQQFDAAPFMADVAWQGAGVGVAFAQIVAKRCKTHLQRHIHTSALVQDHLEMHTGVHLGVVFHGLRHTVQASHFRQQDVQCAAVAQHLQHA